MRTVLAKEKLIEQIGELPPMPEVAQKALQQIKDPESNVADVADVLALDEALTSLILRWANSAYYGLARPVSTVKQAMVYLGYRTVENLILAASMMNMMDRPLPGYGLERGQLWKHAIGVAAGARSVTQIFGRRKAEDAYFAGLLCDIGKLALDAYLRDRAASDDALSDRSSITLEKEVVGLNHAELGAAIAKKWNLPLELQEAIAYHHDPGRASAGSILAAAVHVSDLAADQLSLEGQEMEPQLPDQDAMERLRLSQADYSKLSGKISLFVSETESFLNIGGW